jgi:hypothetical protein
MKSAQLIAQSEAQLARAPLRCKDTFAFNVFESGAEWMAAQLSDGRPVSDFIASRKYSVYGWMKYGLSLMAMIISLWMCVNINLWLLPLSIVVFYLVEVHFLFLFPLLIDDVASPVLTSIQQTYKSGLFVSLLTVMPIGFYMLAGLLNVRDPFRNWHVGCLAVILWYKNEVRNRI